MFEEIFKTIADILSGDKPDPDVLGPDDIERILRKTEREENQSNNQ